MGGSSSSKTSRTYNTTNVSQQGEGNVYGTGNRVTIQRADAMTLDRIAETLGRGVGELSDAGVRQTEAALESNESVSKAAMSTNESVSRAALSFSEKSSMSAMDFVSNYVEREQVGTGGQELETLQYTAVAVAVALVGIAWASK